MNWPGEEVSSNSMDKHDGKMHEDIGYIKGLVEGIDKKLTEQNGAIALLTKKVTKHDVILGKIGMVLSVAIFVITMAFNIVIEWVKKMFS